MAYWYNIRTKQVEDEEHTSAKDHLLGPYETREDASRAIEKAAENTRRWDEETEDD